MLRYLVTKISAEWGVEEHRRRRGLQGREESAPTLADGWNILEPVVWMIST